MLKRPEVIGCMHNKPWKAVLFLSLPEANKEEQHTWQKQALQLIDPADTTAHSFS
jgi:hypothetical protein